MVLGIDLDHTLGGEGIGYRMIRALRLKGRSPIPFVIKTL